MAEPAQDPFDRVIPDLPPVPPDPEPAPITAGKLLPKAELVDLAAFAAKRAEKLGQTIATLTAGAEARAAEVARSLAAAGFDPRSQADAADKARAKARAEIVANSSEARWAEIRQLVAAAEGLALTEALYASPQAVLARAGLGDPRRTDLMAQVAGAGPAEVRQLAMLAVATKDVVLGAAIQSVNDRLPRRDRPVSSAELADALVGEEARAVSAAVAAIRDAAQRAIVANREFESGRTRSVDRVKLALSNKEA
jgi:hypothetical protein